MFPHLPGLPGRFLGLKAMSFVFRYSCCTGQSRQGGCSFFAQPTGTESARRVHVRCCGPTGAGCHAYAGVSMSCPSSRACLRQRRHGTPPRDRCTPRAIPANDVPSAALGRDQNRLTQRPEDRWYPQMTTQVLPGRLAIPEGSRRDGRGPPPWRACVASRSHRLAGRAASEAIDASTGHRRGIRWTRRSHRSESVAACPATRSAGTRGRRS